MESIMDPAYMKCIVFSLIGAFLYLFCALNLCLSLLAVLTLYLVTGGWRFARIILFTARRDLRGLLFLLDVKSSVRRYTRNGDTVATLFQQRVKAHPDKVAMIMIDERQWTFREVDEYSNAVGNYFFDQGYRKVQILCYDDNLFNIMMQGDVVAILMETRPEFIMLWLGLSKIGVVAALINFNLREDTLTHCITISAAKALIFGSEMTQAVLDIRARLPADMILYIKGEATANGLQAKHIDPILDKTSKLPPPKDHTTCFSEKLFYVYTSGTTGLPKAAIIIHSRFFYMSHSIYFFFKLKPHDVIYDTLPLYHTAGGILGVGNCLLKGCTLVIRRRFSASRYWDDCLQYNCTVSQYIGEICRYLLAQPPKSVDKQHKVWCAFGNGIRPQIWNEFRQRFNIRIIGEFYGATEGNANILNVDSTPGAIGFNTRILPWFYPVQLIKVNQTTGELIRNQRGLCIRCGPGEPGELVGKIVQGDAMREFDGYASAEATKKKIGYDVFTKGDRYFLTGDILEMDEYGYMYFRDRTGDTFRWRGENVSTAEVEAVISNVIQLNDAVVYGVEIPGIEGRAGMATIVDEQHSTDLKRLNVELQRVLPPYARPVFLRFVDKLDITGTFKLKKVDYQKQGYNPNIVHDTMYYLDPKSNKYEVLNKQSYDAICSGRVRF